MNQHLERLEQLAPVLRLPAYEFIRLAQARLGVTLMVVYTYRDFRVQAELYRQGRTYDGTAQNWNVVDQSKVVTDAKPGQSAHNVTTKDGQPASLALDVIPLDASGQALWNYTVKQWGPIYHIAAKCGLDAYGDHWGASLPSDAGHLEEPAFKLKIGGLGLVLPDSATQNLV